MGRPLARQLFKDGAAEHASSWNRVNAWEDTVERYSKTLLTFDKDKLIAIAGVAKQFQSAQLGDYCAGLWRNSILSNLTWQCHRSSFRPLGKRGNEKPCHAPSWSWAAVNKSISFGSRTLYDSEAEWLKSNDSMLELAEVHDVTITPLTENPFGEILAGQIELSAWLLRERTQITQRDSRTTASSLGLDKKEHGDDFTFPLDRGSTKQREDLPVQIHLFDSDIPYSDEVTASFDRGVPLQGDVYLLPLYWVSSWSGEPDESSNMADSCNKEIEYQYQKGNFEIESDQTGEIDETSNRWIFLLALLLTPVDENIDASVKTYERVGALNDWIDPSEAFGAAITAALKIFWDPVEKQAKPGTERARTRIRIV
ncbi:hypothetical protein DL767_003344 [Monosporascus sp. MG133]|nr:hypothetical protein DL767_003344 [Monosporascus sp. MG133]